LESSQGVFGPFQARILAGFGYVASIRTFVCHLTVSPLVSGMARCFKAFFRERTLCLGLEMGDLSIKYHQLAIFGVESSFCFFSF